MGDVAVFNAFDGTVADTRHTVRALVAPNGFFIHDSDIIERTKFGAFSTAHTRVGRVKILCFEFIFAPNGV